MPDWRSRFRARDESPPPGRGDEDDGEPDAAEGPGSRHAERNGATAAGGDEAVADDASGDEARGEGAVTHDAPPQAAGRDEAGLEEEDEEDAGPPRRRSPGAPHRGFAPPPPGRLPPRSSSIRILRPEEVPDPPPQRPVPPRREESEEAGRTQEPSAGPPPGPVETIRLDDAPSPELRAATSSGGEVIRPRRSPSAPASAGSGSVRGEEVRQRILEATYACVARWGISKTTVEDAGRQAGVSRATVYRYFPGGRDELVSTVISWEYARFFTRLYEEVQDATSLEEVMERGLVFAHRAIAEHEVLQRVLETEPEVLLPHLTVEADRTIDLIADFLVPYLLVHGVSPSVDAHEAAAFLARMVLSYISSPGQWDLEDPEQVARLVRAELLGGMVGEPARGRHRARDQGEPPGR